MLDSKEKKKNQNLFQYIWGLSSLLPASVPSVHNHLLSLDFKCPVYLN